MMYTAWYVHKIIVLYEAEQLVTHTKALWYVHKIIVLYKAEQLVVTHTHKALCHSARFTCCLLLNPVSLCADFDRACNYECFCWKVVTTVLTICICMWSVIVWMRAESTVMSRNGLDLLFAFLFWQLDHLLPRACMLHWTGNFQYTPQVHIYDILHIWCTNACCHWNWSA